MGDESWIKIMHIIFSKLKKNRYRLLFPIFIFFLSFYSCNRKVSSTSRFTRYIPLDADWFLQLDFLQLKTTPLGQKFLEYYKTQLNTQKFWKNRTPPCFDLEKDLSSILITGNSSVSIKNERTMIGLKGLFSQEQILKCFSLLKQPPPSSQLVGTDVILYSFPANTIFGNFKASLIFIPKEQTLLIIGNSWLETIKEKVLNPSSTIPSTNHVIEKISANQSIGDSLVSLFIPTSIAMQSLVKSLAPNIFQEIFSDADTLSLNIRGTNSTSIQIEVSFSNHQNLDSIQKANELRFDVFKNSSNSKTSSPENLFQKKLTWEVRRDLLTLNWIFSKEETLFLASTWLTPNGELQSKF